MTQSDDDQQAAPRGRARFILAALPLLIFVGLAAVFLTQLQSGRSVTEIPSALLGTKAPALELPALQGAGRPALTLDAIKGKLTLVNVFASWCVPCRQEHPVLLELSKDPRITVVGINYKDRNDNALRFLGELGNPYAAIGVDPNGKAAIDWGVYGIPETYLVSRDGIILYKKVGPFDPDTFRTELMPVIEKALSGA